jgi:hypothetical protein
MLGPSKRINQFDNFMTNNPSNKIVSPRNVPFNHPPNNYFSNPYIDQNA